MKINEFVENEISIDSQSMEKIKSAIFFHDKWDFPFEIYKIWLSRRMVIPSNFDMIAIN